MIVKFDIELMNPKADPDNYVFEFALTSDRGTLAFRLDKSEYDQLASTVMEPTHNYEKLEWIHSAIQESQNGNDDLLDEALRLVEDLREPLIPDNPLMEY